MKHILTLLTASTSFCLMANVINSSIASRHNAMMNQSQLPYDAEVEYIGCDGGQFINTGVNLLGATSFDYDVCASSTSPAPEQRIFSSEGSSPTYDLYLVNETKFACRPLNTRTSFEAGDAIRALYLNGELSLFVNGEVKNQRTTAFIQVANSQSIYLMRRANNNAGPYKLIGRFYYATFAINGEVVRDMVPVRFRNEQGISEGAMYDRVTGRLFRNNGAGAFSIGPDL